MMFISMVIMTIGMMEIAGIDTLDFSGIKNPWGVIMVLVGAVGFIFTILHDHDARLYDLEREIWSKQPDSETETGQESK